MPVQLFPTALPVLLLTAALGAALATWIDSELP